MTNKRFHYDWKTGRMKDTYSSFQATKNMRLIERQINDACQSYEKQIAKLEKKNEQLNRQIGNLEHTRDFCDEVCADCERLENENKQLKEENEQLKREVKRLDDLWGEKCVKEYLTVCGESILKEMHDEKYGDKG